VIVFNGRTNSVDYGGVEYRPTQEVVEYMREKVPAAQIAWRHTERLSLGKTWVWLHDLSAPGLERIENYDYALCLSEFHKRYVQTLFGVPEEKVKITRNGINPRRWENADYTKEGNRVVFSSSPDRGIVQALLVMDRVVKEIPDATFHCYYGFDNLIKMGQSNFVHQVQRMINERPWVTFHGNIDQATLTKEMCRSKVWLYPTVFLETFAITAIEAVLSKCYPVVRKYGALPYTLAGHPSDILDHPADTNEQLDAYAQCVIAALREEKWKSLNADPEKLSWRSVAHEWSQMMDLTVIPS
jgi:hypothetical protein